MREANLAGVSPHRKGFTHRDPKATLAPDLVNRDFTASAPNRLWVTDLTMIATGEGPLWLSAIRDAFSRRVVAWETSARADADLVLSSLEYALASREVEPGKLIHHADHGCQGGFNRSLQHLVLGGVDGQASRVDGGVDRAIADEVPGCAGASAGSRTSVLARDREGVSGRGGGSCGRGIPGGGLQMVSARWRHATNGSCSAVRPVPVLSRA
ncbi:DDE-type integrase/transposase/recombinase [Streptomyces sp900116325]|uniref:DDE-type integrase/transposase/recombinase n=1 Tax=Streptomyces sp. 900116325 TaxID=3154295 RepID=UPI0033B060C8